VRRGCATPTATTSAFTIKGDEKHERVVALAAILRRRQAFAKVTSSQGKYRVDHSAADPCTLGGL
jgi:hypothetical protein